MHIRRLTIKNVRAISEFDLTLQTDECAGWHVLLGENGSGKSTAVRALATVLMGAVNAHASRQDWSSWLRDGEQTGSVEVRIRQDPVDRWVGKGNTSPGAQISALAEISRSGGLAGPNGAAPSIIEFSPRRYANRTVWGSGTGWFSASFGPFRRFRGSDPEVDRLYYSHPRLAPHLSALGEHVALGESLRWLRELQTRALEKDWIAGRMKDAVVNFVNNAGLLPYGARIAEVTSTQVTMLDGQEARVAIEEMSDGYRSILSMTLELLRLMSHIYPVDHNMRIREDGTVHLPGVVAIDEVDAHLHPQWQKQIGEWFIRHFPETQFFVTTHSPIICRAATSVWKLPPPGSNASFRRVTGAEYGRLVDGSILDAYSTQLFGEGVTRSQQSERKVARLAELSQKQLYETLSPDEELELHSLRTTMPSTPTGLASG